MDSNNLLTIVKKHGEFHPHSYQDKNGAWKIGYGSQEYMDGSSIKPDDSIDEASAAILLDRDLQRLRSEILNFIPTTLPQGAVDALTSFAHSHGTMKLLRSSLLKKIKENPLNLKVIEKEFKKWDKEDGNFSQKMSNKRNDEAKMFNDAILSQYSKYELLYKNPPK